MLESTRAQVRTRARNRCEYCGLSGEDSPIAPLQIDHVIPRQHGGDDALDNLALCCIDCNLHKGPNLTGIDPATGQITELFNPRRHDWHEHFEQIGAVLLGKTPVGRTSVRVLGMNSIDRITLRST